MNRLTIAALTALLTPATLSLAEPDKKTDESAPATPAAAAMPGLKVGDRVPDPQLAKPSGDPVQLSELYARTPVVLVFYRGGWCPYCNKQLSALQDQVENIGGLGAFIVAVTPEGPTQIEKTIADQSLKYAILSDYQHQAAEQFKILFTMAPEMQEKYKGYGVDLSEKNWDKTWRLPHPAAYVIDTQGVIRYAFCSEDYKQRADPEEIKAVLKQILDAKMESKKKKP